MTSQSREWDFIDEQGEIETVEAATEQAAWQALAERFGYSCPTEIRYGLGIKLVGGLI